MWKYFMTHFCLLIFLRIISCCQCNFNQSNTSKEKRQLESEEYSTVEYLEHTRSSGIRETHVEIVDMSSTTQDESTSTNGIIYEINESTTESNNNIRDIFELKAIESLTIPEQKTTTDIANETNEISSEITEVIFEKPESSTESIFLRTVYDNETSTENVSPNKTEEHSDSNSDLWKKCRHYKNGNSFNLEKMVDIWQVAYCRLPNKLKCFKLRIKEVKHKEQRRYARVYGNFNDTVHWFHCSLEITSSERASTERRHFLQGTQNDKGVMQNVIIDEDYWKNSTYLTLHRESGDQWLVINNLLMMRDCENGDYVVFTRYPFKSREAEIRDALRMFGVKKPNGTKVCNEKSWLIYDDDHKLKPKP